MIPSNALRFSFKSLLFSLFLSALPGCETVEYAGNLGPDWLTTTDGAKVWFGPKLSYQQTFTWDGARDANGYAHGVGSLTSFLPESSTLYQQTVERSGRMVNGKLVGDVYTVNSIPAKSSTHSIERYQGGAKTAETQVSQQVWGGDSGGNDDVLIGSLFALGGAMGGEASVVEAGAMMIGGDSAGAVGHLNEWATSGSGSQSGAGGRNASAAGNSSGMGASSNQANLIDQYGLSRYRNAGSDHIRFYIKAADAAYSNYQKAGESGYYDQHREYADLARDFHNRTR